MVSFSFHTPGHRPMSFTHIYRPQTKFPKVMFLQVSICPWGGGMRGRGACVVGGMHGREACVAGACVVGGHAWQEGYVWWGACMAGGMCGREAMCGRGCVHGRVACIAGGMRGRRACMAGGHAWQGACMACMAGGMHGMHAPQQILRDIVNELVVCILLECILVEDVAEWSDLYPCNICWFKF